MAATSVWLCLHVRAGSFRPADCAARTVVVHAVAHHRHLRVDDVELICGGGCANGPKLAKESSDNGNGGNNAERAMTVKEPSGKESMKKKRRALRSLCKRADRRRGV
eukprot:3151292-Pleurochrysis_carterae.AAC.3